MIMETENGKKSWEMKGKDIFEKGNYVTGRTGGRKGGGGRVGKQC